MPRPAAHHLRAKTELHTKPARSPHILLPHKSVVGTPNQLASDPAYWSREVVGIQRPSPVASSGPARASVGNRVGSSCTEFSKSMGYLQLDIAAGVRQNSQ